MHSCMLLIHLTNKLVLLIIALKSPCSQLTVFIFWLLVHKTDQSTLWVIQVIHVFLLHGGNSLFHLTLILTLLFVF